MRTWRDLRYLTQKQRLFLDALTCQGPFSQDYCARNGFPFTRTPKALYGGAGYGGKSYCLRSAIPEINATYCRLGIKRPVIALFSSTYRTLADRQIAKFDRENPILNSDGTLTDITPLSALGEVKENKTFGLHFRFYEKDLGVCCLRNLDDPDKYRGVEFYTSLFEELTEVMREDWDAVSYATRGGGLPFSAMGGVSNPDGPGAGWVKKLFVDRDYEDEPLGTRPEDFLFIQSYIRDNPAATEDDHNRLLSMGDPMLVKARYYGEWDVLSGLRFSQFSRGVHVFDWEDFLRYYNMPLTSDPYQVLGERAEAMGITIYGSLDYGTGIDSASAFHLHAVDYDKRCWTFFELTMRGTYIDEQAERMRDIIDQFKPRRIYADPSLEGRGRESDGISVFRKFRDRKVPLISAPNDRIQGWVSYDVALNYRRDDHGGILVPPAWRMHRSCKGLIQDILNAPRDPKKPEDVDPQDGKHHWLDGCRYFLHSHYGPGYRPHKKVVFGTAEWFAMLSKRARDTKGYIRPS